ncbi:hypothetical protein L5M18_22375 [Shewanella sp. SM20]|uniref:hypothetical protein n=1 Tax=Shewanella sp. SM20 TaxID=2912792 RepID=UPI0021D88A85|nr:hypothetical protein [Shewanella sp. SM20]MCU8094255.1 hypothetical protein [Shewanella sp. SM20]
MNKAKSLLVKLGVGTGITAAASTSAFAAGGDYTSQIAAAIDAASSNQTAVILGVVTLAAIGFGVGRLLGWFK